MSKNNDAITLLEKNFDIAFAAPDGIKKLRELILSLAMQGKLVPQNPSDQPASELLKEIEAEKSRLIKDGKIKASNPFLEIKSDEVPYDLPKGWEWVRLREIANYNGRTNISPEQIEPDTWLLDLEDIEKDTSRIIYRAKYAERESKSTKSTFLKGDVLYGKLRPYLNKVVVADDDGVCTTEIVPIVLFGDIDSHFLKWALKRSAFLDYVNSLMYGVKMPRLGTEQAIASIHPLPPLAEQRRIVTKIDELMARCDELEKLKTERNQKQIIVHKSALNRLLTAKDHSDFKTSWHFITQHFGELYSVKENVAELRKAILQLAVMGKLVPQDNNDQPANELLKEIEKEKNRLVTEKKLKIGQLTSDTKRISENIVIPSSWVWVKGVDLFFITKLAGFEYTEHINLLDDGEVPVIRAQNVKPFRLDLNNLKYIDLKTSKLLERCALTKESLLVTFIGAGIGDVALFDFQERWHLAPNVAKMEPFLDCENKVNLKYIACFLNSPLGRDEIFKHLKSTAQPSISMGTIRDIDYPLPPLVEQHRIVAKIDQLMTLCNELEKQIDAAESKQTNLLNSVMTKI